MYRKTSFGTQSEEGSRFVERIFTATTTLKLQGRDVLAFLTETLTAHRCGLLGPSLLPTAHAPQLALAACDPVNGYKPGQAHLECEDVWRTSMPPLVL